MSHKQIIKKLEERVESTVEFIRGLKQTNRKLSLEREAVQKKLRNYEIRIKDLEKIVDSAQKEQYILEKSVLAALSSLDEIEELQHNSENVSEITKDNITIDDAKNSLELETTEDSKIEDIIFENEESSEPESQKTEKVEIF